MTKKFNTPASHFRFGYTGNFVWLFGVSKFSFKRGVLWQAALEKKSTIVFGNICGFHSEIRVFFKEFLITLC